MKHISSPFIMALIVINWHNVAMATPKQQNPVGMVKRDTAHTTDNFTPLMPENVHFNGGFLGVRIDANETNRMLKVDENDLLDAFEHRDKPHQDWQGEHVGKFLHAAVLSWNYSRDAALKTKIDRVVNRLLKTQESDGYLGTYPKAKHWTSWDVWVHKYDLLGLLTYYQFTTLANKNKATALGNQSLAACIKVGDLLCATFGTEPGKRDINKAGQHVGMAADSVLEPVVLLYRATGDMKYLNFAQYIVKNYDAPGGPAILASLEKTHSVRKVANAKAYEMTSNFNGLLELYRVTGDKQLLKEMLTAWRDIVENRLYITGSASAGEHFQENDNLPNDMGHNICETCVTVTWEQMNMELLRITGQAMFADEIEKSAYNHLLAAQKPTGDDWAYYTPLEGHKPYDAGTTCCHSSGPRGVALLPAIACMVSEDGGLAVNLYNAGTADAKLKSGGVHIQQFTEYPNDGAIRIVVTPAKNGQKFSLRLRIPAWAIDYTLTVNGKPLSPTGKLPNNYGYVVLNRAWRKNDEVKLVLPLPVRVIKGDHDNEGKAAIMRGPVVLALDAAANQNLGSLKRIGLGIDPVKPLPLLRASGNSRPDKQLYVMTGDVAGKGKTTIGLIPYASAGEDGESQFEVWIPLDVSKMDANSSLFTGSRWGISRKGNVMGDINDDDVSTFAVTFDDTKENEDWFAVTLPKAVMVDRVIFAHGKTFHDGGWFDTDGGKNKPQIQVQTEVDGAWKTVATLESYPNTTAKDAAGLKDGQKFEVKFAPVAVFGVRVVGKPASGDSDKVNFSSCAELEAFSDKP